MKKLALVAAIAAAFTGSAFAQSSVTLYGRINTSVEFQDNGVDDQVAMISNASRWGLRGNEDLGGGLSAFFNLEAGFGSDNGAASSPGFGREAFVGLKSDSLGQIKLGKFTSALYYSTIDYIGTLNHNTGTTSDDNLYFLAFSHNNAVEYTSPSFGGVTFAVTANAGEGSNANAITAAGAASKGYEFVVSYDIDGLHLGGGYSKSENVAGDTVVEGWTIGGYYTIGALGLGLSINQPDVAGAGKAEHYAATAMYTIGAMELHATFGHITEFDDVPDSDATQFALGVGYNLSKRTKLYAFYYNIDQNGVVYVNGNVGGLPNEKLQSVAVGLRHNF